MSNRRHSSKRSIKILLKYGDSVCILDNRKNNQENSVNNSEGNKIGVDFGDVNNGGKGVDDDVNNGSKVGDTEMEVVEELNGVHDVATPNVSDGKIFSGCSDDITVSHKSVIENDIGNQCDVLEQVLSTQLPNLTNDVPKHKNNQLEHYAKLVSQKDKTIDNTLSFIPTEVDEDREVVIFDEELVKRGSEKWKVKLCGYFVRANMHINELRYNLRRMWSRIGLEDIIPHVNGMFCFSSIMQRGINMFWRMDHGLLIVSN